MNETETVFFLLLLYFSKICDIFMIKCTSFLVSEPFTFENVAENYKSETEKWN